MNSLKNLKDIRGLEKIPDLSYYIFLALVILGILLFISLVIYMYGVIKKRKKTKRKLYIQKLKSVSFNDPKKAAYEITRYARKLADTKESKAIFERLEEDLKRYKYKKVAPKFDDDSKKLYKLFLEVCCG